MILLAALLTALACLALLAPRPASARLRALAAAHRPAPLWALVAAALAFVAPAFGVLVVAALLAAPRISRARLAAHSAAATRAALPELCRATAAELRTGRPPPDALAAAAEDLPPPLAAHVRRLAADPTGAWDALPGAERLRAVAALWTVAADAGSGLADGLDRLAATLAAEERRRADVAAQLAGPKATAAVLAALPLCGVALAMTLGADPAAFLLRTPPGLACLVAGASLDACGVLWVRRLTRAALA